MIQVNKKFALTIPAILMINACTLLAPVDREKYSDIEGHIFSLDTNAPLPNAEVNILETGNSERTDRNGKFFIRALPVGWVNVEIKSNGYQTITRKVRIEPFGTKYIDMSVTNDVNNIKGEKIVFERAGDIWVTDEYGLNQANITEKIKEQSLNPDISQSLFFNSPVWMDNKSKIAYIANDAATNAHTKNGLWIMNANGKLNQRVTYVDSKAFRLTVNPKGDNFIFSMINPDNASNIGLYSYNSHNSKTESLSGVMLSRDYNPKWSPKSDQITYSSSLTQSPNVINTYDATQLGAPKNQIFVMNSNGLNKKQLTISGDNNDPSWSPDGQKIVFISNRTGSAEVWIMNKDGSGQRRLTETGATRAANPTWSSDGQRIMFSTNYKQKYSSLNPTELWVYEPSTYSLRMITNDAYNADW